MIFPNYLCEMKLLNLLKESTNETVRKKFVEKFVTDKLQTIKDEFKFGLKDMTVKFKFIYDDAIYIIIHTNRPPAKKYTRKEKMFLLEKIIKRRLLDVLPALIKYHGMRVIILEIAYTDSVTLYRHNYE